MRHDFPVSGKVAKITKEATLQHDEPRRPGAARPSLLSAEPQAEAATNILGNLEGGTKSAPAAARVAGPKPAGMVWGGVALVVALLGGGAVWLGAESDSEAGHGSAPILADDAQPAPTAAPRPATAASAAAPALAADAFAAPAAADTGAAPAVPAGDAAAAPAAQAVATAPGSTGAGPAPGNSADLVAALAAPSKASTAATIQEEAPAQRQSLREMLNAPSDTKAAPPAPKVAGHDGKANAKAGKPARVADKSNKAAKTAKTAKADKTDKAARTARAGKPAAPAKTQPAPAPDSDVALLAALVAHTHASTAARQPESLSAKLKQCRQLSAKGAEQCRARTCATAKDDPLCKPVVTAAVEGAYP
jgi:hypothetical protein